MFPGRAVGPHLPGALALLRDAAHGPAGLQVSCDWSGDLLPSSDWSVSRIHRMRRRKMRLGGSSGGGGSGSGGSSDENKRLGRLHHLDSGTVLYCTVLYCTVLYWLHHLDSGTVLLLVLGPCSLLLLVYILVMLCRSEVFTLSIGEWPLAITVTWGLQCTAGSVRCWQIRADHL